VGEKEKVTPQRIKTFVEKRKESSSKSRDVK